MRLLLSLALLSMPLCGAVALPASAGALDHARAAGTLRVGTPGDYAPFSLRRPDGGYQGADVEEADPAGQAFGPSDRMGADELGQAGRRYEGRQIRHRGRRHLDHAGAPGVGRFLDRAGQRRQAPGGALCRQGQIPHSRRDRSAGHARGGEPGRQQRGVREGQPAPCRRDGVPRQQDDRQRDHRRAGGRDGDGRGGRRTTTR